MGGREDAEGEFTYVDYLYDEAEGPRPKKPLNNKFCKFDDDGPEEPAVMAMLTILAAEQQARINVRRCAAWSADDYKASNSSGLRVIR